MPNIRFDKVTAFYGKKSHRKDVLNELSTCFFSQKINVILGESGSGKSTLLKTLVEIVEYDGVIYFDDVDITKTLVNKRNISYASQNINLYPHMTTFENISFPLRVRKYPRDEILSRTRDIAKKLGVEICLNYRGRYLSIGQQQRVMLARELVSRPSVLLMDEPFSNLDYELRKEMIKLIKSLAKEYHLTILFVTHLYEEAMLLADQLFVLEDGKIVASGTPQNLLDANNEYLKLMHDNAYVDVSKLNEKKKNNKR